MSKSSTNPWIIVAYAVVMQAFTSGIAIYAFTLFVVPWMNEFQVQRSALMLGVTGSSITLAILAPISGVLLDKYPARQLILASTLTYIAGLVALSLAQGYELIVFIFALILPVGLILSGPLMAYSVVARVIVEGRGLALGITSIGSSVGGLFIPLLVSFLLGSEDWQTVFRILAVLGLLCVFIPGFFILGKEAPQQHQEEAKSGPSGWQLMRSRPVMMLSISFLAPSLLFVGLLHNLGAYAFDLGVAQRQAAWIISSASIVMVMGKLFAGWMSDRVNHRLMYTSIVVIIALGIFVTTAANSFYTLLAGVCLISIVLGGLGPLTASIVANQWSLNYFGRVMGVVQGFAALSSTGALIAAYIRDTTGSYPQAFLLLSATLVPAIICFYLMPKKVDTKE